MNLITKLSITTLILSTLSGCAAYDKMREDVNGTLADTYTSIVEGAKPITTEDTPNAKKLTLNMKYRLPQADEFYGPKLTGDVVYSQSCKFLSFKVNMKNPDDVLLHTPQFTFMDYKAGSKRIFDQNIRKIDGRDHSSKVKSMFVHDIHCGSQIPS